MDTPELMDDADPCIWRATGLEWVPCCFLFVASPQGRDILEARWALILCPSVLRFDTPSPYTQCLHYVIHFGKHNCFMARCTFLQGVDLKRQITGKTRFSWELL